MRSLAVVVFMLYIQNLISPYNPPRLSRARRWPTDSGVSRQAAETRLGSAQLDKIMSLISSRVFFCLCAGWLFNNGRKMPRSLVECPALLVGFQLWETGCGDNRIIVTSLSPHGCRRRRRLVLLLTG